MKMRWSEDETIQLIELYKSYRYLWDSTMELYKNGIARKKAYDDIVKQMCIPRLTAQDVRSKIKNLRSSYYHELRKINKVGSDQYNVRKLPWFQAFKPIMGAVQLRKEVMTESETSEEEQEESCFIEEGSSNMDAYVVSIKQEYLDEMEHNDEKDIAPVDDYLEPVPKKQKTYEQKTFEQKTLEQKTLEKNTVERPDLELPTTSAKGVKGRVDEFQMFSHNIAAQLRRMPLDRALIIQVEIQSLVAKERIRIFKRQGGDSKCEDDSS